MRSYSLQERKKKEDICLSRKSKPGVVKDVTTRPVKLIACWSPVRVTWVVSNGLNAEVHVSATFARPMDSMQVAHHAFVLPRGFR